MSAFKYKVGDKVRIKGIDWYNENKNSVDNCDVVFADGWLFSKHMSNFCGKELIIEKISHATNPPHYIMKDTMFAWTDEMIEGLVKEETKVGTALNPIEPKSNANCLIMERVDELVKEENEKKLSDESWRYKNIFDSSQYPQSFECPEGYIFKDENGNVINATKIVLEKKKKEYPKTYEECCGVLGIEGGRLMFNSKEITEYEENLICKIGKLEHIIVCRDAYWKIAGEEMGLGKLWVPDWAMYSGLKHCIIYSDNEIKWRCKSFVTEAKILAFPTEEMRDAFYENFKEEIEICKELL